MISYIVCLIIIILFLYRRRTLGRLRGLTNQAVDADGKSVSFSSIGKYVDGLAKVKKDGKVGFINEQKKVVIPCEYDEIDNFVLGFAIAKKNGKYGFVNTKGEEVVPCKYDYVCDFKEGFGVKQNDKWGMVKKDGKVIMPCRYDEIKHIDNSYYFVVKQNGKWGIVKKDGKVIMPCRYDKIENRNEDKLRNIVAYRDGKWDTFYYDREEILTYESLEKFANSLNGLTQVMNGIGRGIQDQSK